MKDPFGFHFGEFCLQVEGSRSKLEVWEVQKALPTLQILLPRPGGWGVGSLIGSWRAWEGIWKGLGWLRGGWGPGSGANMSPTWAQLEPTWGQHRTNLSRLGANLGPCWVQIGSSRPSCSKFEAILRLLGAYMIQDAKNDPKIIEICSKHYWNLILSKLLKSKFQWKM